jgi:hypothetical protein
VIQRHRVTVASASAFALVVILGTLSESRGREYFSSQAKSLENELAIERSRAAQYRRQVFQEPLEQNAAVWYRLAFAEIGRLPRDTVEVLANALEAGTTKSQTRPEEILHTRCREATGSRVREALRCTHCNWELDPDSEGSSLEALVLGRCLVLVGGLSAHVGTAIKSYVDALALASDLGQADFATNVVGIIVANTALRELSAIITSPTCQADCLDLLSERLSAFENYLPTVRKGVRLAALELAGELQRESLPAHAGLLGSLLPRYAVAGWHLSRDQLVLDSLRQGTIIRDPEKRPGLRAEIRQELERSKGEKLIASVDRWNAAMTDADEVARDFRGVLTAIEIERLHVRTGRYPEGRELFLTKLRDEGLRYERSSDGAGYTIIRATGRRIGTVVVKHPPTS